MNILDWNMSFITWVLFVVTLLTYLYYLGTKSHHRFSKYNIPHLKSLPFIGSLGLAIFKQQTIPSLLLDIYNKLKEFPYGGFYVFSLSVFMINDPDLIKTLTVKDFEYFMDHRSLLPENYSYQNVWTKGLFTLRGK